MTQTNLNKDQLSKYRRMLLDRRQEIVGTMQELENELSQEKGGMTPGAANTDFPSHLADAASDARTERMTRRLSDRERENIREIDEALERMRNGTYGLCVVDQQPISQQRLNAKPWARYCIHHAEEAM